MSKISRIEVRIEKSLKDSVNLILQETGLTMSKAIYFYLRRISESGKLPFDFVGSKNKRLKSRAEELAMSPEEFGKYLSELD